LSVPIPNDVAAKPDVAQDAHDVVESAVEGLPRRFQDIPAPIKVNQLREVVEEILDAGRSFHYGIEVGSKPEMFAGLSSTATTSR
jgi:hypothetical protein